MKSQKAVALRITNLLIKNKMSQYELSKRMLTDSSTIKQINQNSQCFQHDNYRIFRWWTI